MSKEIIINVTGEHSRIAIVEDGELVELYIENPENVRTIGDIYLGRVRRILPGIKAAFVDIGQKQDAFLHFSDLSDNLPDLLELSEGKVADHLKKHLAKAPRQLEDGGDSGLELETPQEQRAARRRRDLKRTHGRGRRKGKQDEAQKEDAPEAEKAEAQTQQPETKKPDSRSQRPPRGAKKREAPKDAAPEPTQEPTEARSEPRRRAAAPPQPPASDEVPGKSPAILPPDAVEPAPGQEATEAEGPADEPPKKRRRGGRGRGHSRTADQQADTPQADEGAEQEAADTRQRSRSRGGRSPQRKEAAPAEAQSTDTPTEAPTQEADTEQRPPRRKKRTSAKQTRQAEGPEAEKPEAEEADRSPEKPKPAAKAEPAVKAEPARSSSRFVIDLTSKPGRADRDLREEEEEEEEQGSRRSGRSSSRGGRRRGRSSRSGRSKSGSDAAESKTDNNGSGSGRSNARGGSRSNGSGGNGSNGPRPETYLKQDQKLVVKITKEPISSKGPRVSTDVSLAGRFLVLIPQADYVAVSKKIESSKERRRLRALARSLLPEGFGLIVRTVAENRDAKALDTDLRLLLQKWHKIEDQLRKKPNPPVALYEDVNMVSSIIRDLFSEDYDRIVVDDPKVHRNVKSYVQAVAPQMAPAVELYKGKEHVFRKYKIDGEVRAAFERRVPLPGGGYLFIEHTEAMHVVDVNSGRAGRGLSQEENALRVNLESARVIAKQLRLRDLGGIIVVDFIDMRSDGARKKVYDELKKEFRKDRAVTKLLPMSDFGVVQITRQRLRPSITTTTNVEDLPQAEEEPEVIETEAAVERPPVPTGPQPSAAEVVGKLERWLATYRDEVQDQHRRRPILVKLHPFLAAYLQRGIPSTLTRWKFKTRLNFRLDVDESADPLSFSVRDEKSGKNLTKKYDRDEQPAA